MINGLTSKVKVLIAAVQLEERGEIPFTGYQLVVEAWKRFPETFGLEGCEQEHPCSHSVIYILCGKFGLPKKGLLGKVGKNKYILTPEGRAKAYREALAYGEPLGKPAPTPLPTSNGVNLEVNAFLNRVVNGQAFTKSISMETARISFKDSCEMWGIEDTDKGEIIKVRLEEFNENVKTLDHLLRGMNGEIVMRDGRSVTWDDMATISALDKSLRRQCYGHIRVLEERL